MKKIGLDVGSTTIKCVVLDENDQIVFSDYRRHYSHIKDNMIATIETLIRQKIVDDSVLFAISGSAGMGIADGIGVTFVQEVYATRIAANQLIPNTD